jgi:hypothetical protein
MSGLGLHICSVELEVEKAKDQDSQDDEIDPKRRGGGGQLLKNVRWTIVIVPNSSMKIVLQRLCATYFRTRAFSSDSDQLHSEELVSCLDVPGS